MRKTYAQANLLVYYLLVFQNPNKLRDLIRIGYLCARSNQTFGHPSSARNLG
uniref:Uncharacterized protein n=1 Tax=Nelumbo nucifera TaxID=4432 RepID=A0A822XHI9_NELNU|nr:TPA_asm: hypothetical protein HUJ06_019748 [Nelumbo nucifera]